MVLSAFVWGRVRQDKALASLAVSLRNCTRMERGGWCGQGQADGVVTGQTTIWLHARDPTDFIVCARITMRDASSHTLPDVNPPSPQAVFSKGPSAFCIIHVPRSAGSTFLFVKLTPYNTANHENCHSPETARTVCTNIADWTAISPGCMLRLCCPAVSLRNFLIGGGAGQLVAIGFIP